MPGVSSLNNATMPLLISSTVRVSYDKIAKLLLRCQELSDIHNIPDLQRFIGKIDPQPTERLDKVLPILTVLLKAFASASFNVVAILAAGGKLTLSDSLSLVLGFFSTVLVRLNNQVVNADLNNAIKCFKNHERGVQAVNPGNACCRLIEKMVIFFLLLFSFLPTLLGARLILLVAAHWVNPELFKTDSLSDMTKPGRLWRDVEYPYVDAIDISAFILAAASGYQMFKWRLDNLFGGFIKCLKTINLATFFLVIIQILNFCTMSLQITKKTSGEFFQFLGVCDDQLNTSTTDNNTTLSKERPDCAIYQPFFMGLAIFSLVLTMIQTTANNSGALTREVLEILEAGWKQTCSHWRLAIKNMILILLILSAQPANWVVSRAVFKSFIAAMLPQEERQLSYISYIRTVIVYICTLTVCISDVIFKIRKMLSESQMEGTVSIGLTKKLTLQRGGIFTVEEKRVTDSRSSQIQRVYRAGLSS